MLEKKNNFGYGYNILSINCNNLHSLLLMSTYTTGMKIEIIIKYKKKTQQNQTPKLHSYLQYMTVIDQSVDTLFIICMQLCKMVLQMLVQTCFCQSIFA